jgi:transglutaminase superfamily protein
MKRLRSFLRLAPPDRRLLIAAALLVGTIRLGLWLLPFQTMQRILGRLTPRPPRMAADDPTSAAKIAWAVETTARYLPAATCLTQALAAQVLLSRRGLSARVHIGVSKGANQRLEAHAWVESQGTVVIGGSGRERYSVLAVLSGSSGRPEPPLEGGNADR